MSAAIGAVGRGVGGAGPATWARAWSAAAAIMPSAAAVAGRPVAPRPALVRLSAAGAAAACGAVLGTAGALELQDPCEFLRCAAVLCNVALPPLHGHAL